MRSEAYRKNFDFTIKLHELLAQDKGDSDEADAIRDEMDRPWQDMSPDEKRIVNRLSGDLYTITDPDSPSMAAPPELAGRMAIACLLKDGDQILELLVKTPGFGSEVERAELRGLAYTFLGEIQAASLFMARAKELKGL